MKTRMRRAAARLLAAFFVVVAVPAALAEAGWFEAGDLQLRTDLQLLNDAEIIRYPVTQWPVPRDGVAYALAHAKEHFAINSAVMTALERVRARFGGKPTRFSVIASGGKAGLWRDFDTFAREDGELGASATHDGDRFAASLRLTGAVDPKDGQDLRADGSHATVELGNWLVSAHTLERWWGPGHEGSLILGNNARPMPTLMIERASARPFETPWLSWLGPWTTSFGVSRMESSRQDIDAPLFLAWRITVMPFKNIEFGFSRTAQFCGKQLECNLSVFGNLLAGNDNVGIDATPANEPGNQMAGFDVRWNSPLFTLPYAIYAQYIGEDESGYLPAKYLAMLGAETWRTFADGGIVQVHAEYASTTCSANTSRGPYYNCAYNQGRFDVEGYRYRGRVIGYPSDRDAENYSLGASYTVPRGDVWTATARKSRLNRDDFGDVRNLVASVPTTYEALELGWNGSIKGQKLRIEAGAQALEPARSERKIEPYGYLGWHYDFAL
jgi:hypothetical protein